MPLTKETKETKSYLLKRKKIIGRKKKFMILVFLFFRPVKILKRKFILMAFYSACNNDVYAYLLFCFYCNLPEVIIDLIKMNLLPSQLVL